MSSLAPRASLSPSPSLSDELNENASPSPSPDPDANLMAAMGFATFGSTAAVYKPPREKSTTNEPASKKRKHNHPSSASGSGANTAPLGIRKKVSDTGTGTGSREAEAGTVTGQREKSGAAMLGGGFEEGDPGYESSDAGAGGEEVGEGDVKLPSTAHILQRELGAKGSEPPPVQHNLPPRPPPQIPPQQSSPFAQSHFPPDKSVEFGSGEVLTAGELNALRKGVKNESGDTAFFDVSFVEDPWEGLKPVKLPSEPPGGGRGGRGRGRGMGNANRVALGMGRGWG